MEYRNQVLLGDALDRLRELPSEVFQTCVTSPPYWGQRDYGTRRWFDETIDCVHDMQIEHGPHHPGQVEQTKWKKAEAAGKGQTALTSTCSKCGAWYGQLGLEPTPFTYVKHIVEIFREVRRVLRSDGTLWLNLGDSYAGGRHEGHKVKDLIGVPWLVAVALQRDGWWLRSDIIWHKPNVMPESVKDRPTRAHEYVFLLTKSANYFYDKDAILEPPSQWPLDAELDPSQARNRRSVWSIRTHPYKGAHFAVFPPELPKLCIKAGASEFGCCSKCLKPWVKTESSWAPTCVCDVAAARCLVMDPFAGSGTTLMMAAGLDHDWTGIEVNPEYLPLISERVKSADRASRGSFARAMREIVERNLSI